MAAAFLIARDYTRSLDLADRGPNALILQQTAIFAAFIIQKIARSAFTARSLNYNLWEIGLFTNRWSLYAAALTLGISILVIYVLQVGMVPLPLDMLPKLFLLGLIPAVVEEVVKFIRKKLHPGLTKA
jgi:hypothetical protein